MTEKTMEEKVAAVLSSKAPATLKTLAAATGLTELEARSEEHTSELQSH